MTVVVVKSSDLIYYNLRCIKIFFFNIGDNADYSVQQFVMTNSLLEIGIVIPSNEPNITEVNNATYLNISAVPNNNDNDVKRHTEHILVWNTTWPMDHEATEFFIKLVKNDEIQSLLNNKKTPKIKMWQRVYEDMLQ